MVVALAVAIVVAAIPFRSLSPFVHALFITACSATAAAFVPGGLPVIGGHAIANAHAIVIGMLVSTIGVQRSVSRVSPTPVSVVALACLVAGGALCGVVLAVDLFWGNFSLEETMPVVWRVAFLCVVVAAAVLLLAIGLGPLWRWSHTADPNARSNADRSTL